MAIDGVGSRTSFLGSSILSLRSQLEGLQQQLATGRRSNTYAGQGVDRGFALGLRAQLSTLDAYADTATNVNTRLNVVNLSLQRLSDIGGEVKKAAANSTLTLDNAGYTTGQNTARSALAEALQLLNTRSGDRYLFSGRATDTPSVATIGEILDGVGAAAGLKQLIAERKQADLGTGGSGRVAIASPTATSLSATEDVAGSPFGLKLNAVSSNLAGATLTGPIGSPPAVSVDLGATNPIDGEKIKFTFSLPDGSTETIELTASTTMPPPPNTFAIGADSIATKANLQATLTAAVGKLAATSLVAASAVAASDNFFNASPPLRVGTSPFASATTLVAGTAVNTVSWYTGETGSDPARGTAIARVDQSISVQYGARADEQALRSQIQTIAVYAATTTSAADPNATGQVSALNQRISQRLATQPGQQSIQDIQADFAGAQAAIKAAAARQSQSKSIAQSFLDQIDGISNDEVATKILALQTSLQASYQTTSILYQTSLVKFI